MKTLKLLRVIEWPKCLPDRQTCLSVLLFAMLPLLIWSVLVTVEAISLHSCKSCTFYIVLFRKYIINFLIFIIAFFLSQIGLQSDLLFYQMLGFQVKIYFKSNFNFNPLFQIRNFCNKWQTGEIWFEMFEKSSIKCFIKQALLT